jgi:hypothetical protein
MSTGAETLETVSSFVSKPTELIINVAGKTGTFTEKLPLASVVDPRVPPLTVTDTEGMPSPVVAFLTVPVIVTVCAKAVVNEKIKAASNTAEKLRLFLIVRNLVWEIRSIKKPPVIDR